MGRWIIKRRNSFIEALLRPINTSASIILSIYTFVWGIWVINPYWSVFSKTPLGSEYFLGGWAIAAGSVMTYGIIKNSNKSLTIGVFFGFILWLMVSFTHFLSNWQGTGGITALAMALYCAFIYLNIKVNTDNLPFENETDTI